MRRTRTAALAAAATVALAGCGGGDGDGDRERPPAGIQDVATETTETDFTQTTEPATTDE